MTDNIYKAYLDTINESFDSPYKYKWSNSYPGFIKAEFKNAAGSQIVIEFKLGRTMNQWDVSFIRKNGVLVTYDKIDENDALKTFATVIAAIFEFVKNKGEKINSLIFSADKNELGRERLYKKLVNKKMPKDWKMSIRQGQEFAYFTLERK